MLIEVARTIGFGLFINSTYSLMNGNLSFNNLYIALISLAAIAGSYYYEKRSKKWQDKK